VLDVVAKGGGQPLAPRVLADAEHLLGTRLSRVRIHTDAKAADSAAALSARAYTVGHEIVFGGGAFAPETPSGARTLVHELVHVLQQRALSASAGAQLSVSDPSGPLEHEADVITDEALSGRPGPRPSRGVPGSVQRQTSQAKEETAAPIRTGEESLHSYNFDQFSIFIPTNVLLGSRKDITDVKVHLFFAAGSVQAGINNDILLHGLRGASDRSNWITIGVRGILDSANTISDAQIAACLDSVGIHARPQAIRMTGHSRGCDSVVATITGKLITTPIERIFLLDEAVEHARDGSVRYNRVQKLVEGGIPAANITSYESAHKSVNLVTGESAKVRGATYIDLDSDCMAAIGEARLIEDVMALDPKVKAAATANPKIISRIENLHLPPRGSFTTGPATGTKVSIQDFCFDPVTAPGARRRRKASIMAIISDRTLADFINFHNLPRYVGVADWGRLASHEFFVAEIAHELTD